MVNYYGKTTSDISYFSGTTGSEPDIRQELINTLDGKFPEIAKGQIGLLRKMRTSNGVLIPCGCVDSITHEPDKDHWCAVCFGEGHLWDEAAITFYKTLEGSETGNALRDRITGPGLINVPLVVFYIRYSAAITKNDKIVELELDAEGGAGESATSYTRKAIYRIGSVWEYRSDNGRLEYFKIYAYSEDVKYLNAPDFDDLGGGMGE